MTGGSRRLGWVTPGAWSQGAHPVLAGGWLLCVASGEKRARPAPWFLGCPSPHPARQAQRHCTRSAHLLCLTSSD